MDQVKNIIDSVIGNLAKQGSVSAKDIEVIWQNITDAKIQKHTKVAGLKDSQLMIYVDSSPWLYQLNLLKKRLLKDIQQQIPVIKSIYFKLGKVL